MSNSEQHMKSNVHPDATIHKGEHSSIPHPPPQDLQPNRFKPLPDTGWKGPVPSLQGGDSEHNFLKKPPYVWQSEGDKFKSKYTA